MTIKLKRFSKLPPVFMYLEYTSSGWVHDIDTNLRRVLNNYSTNYTRAGKIYVFTNKSEKYISDKIRDLDAREYAFGNEVYGKIRPKLVILLPEFKGTNELVNLVESRMDSAGIDY